MFKEYYPIDGDSKRVYTLKGTTARVEKELEELGMTGLDKDGNPNNSDVVLTKIVADGGEPLLKLCNAILRGEPFTTKDLLDIDKHTVKEAVLDFFYKDVKLLQTLIDSTKILNLQSPSQT